MRPVPRDLAHPDSRIAILSSASPRRRFGLLAAVGFMLAARSYVTDMRQVHDIPVETAGVVPAPAPHAAAS